MAGVWAADYTEGPLHADTWPQAPRPRVLKYLREAGMKKIVIWIGWAALAALNWAALHDILRGEPNVWMEWTVVALSLALVAVTVFRNLRRA